MVRDGDRQVDKQTGTGLLLLAGRLMVMVAGGLQGNEWMMGLKLASKVPVACNHAIYLSAAAWAQLVPSFRLPSRVVLLPLQV